MPTKEQQRMWSKRHYHKDPLRERARKRRQKFGITQAQWDLLFEQQGSRCAICRTETPGRRDWDTDHDHVNGKVRGILCRRCNIMLGLLEDVEYRNAALAYLEKHTCAS